MNKVWMAADTREEANYSILGVFLEKEDAVAVCKRLTDCVFFLELGVTVYRAPIWALFPVVERTRNDIGILRKDASVDLDRVLRIFELTLPPDERWVKLRVG